MVSYCSAIKLNIFVAFIRKERTGESLAKFQLEEGSCVLCDIEVADAVTNWVTGALYAHFS